MKFIVFFFTLSLSLSLYANSIERMEAALKSRPAHTQLREQLGKAYFEKKEYDKVIETLAPYANEIDVESLVVLANAYSEKGEHLNETRALLTFEQRQPDRFRPHYLLGLAYLKNNQEEEAQASFERSVALNASHRPSYDALIDIYIKRNLFHEARPLLVDMVRKFGEQPSFLNTQCRLYAEGGFLKEAIETCRKAISEDVDHAQNHVFLAQAYMDQDNRSAAENIFRTAARRFTNSEFVQWRAGEFYFNEKNFPTAARYLTEAVKADPESGRSRLGLALALFSSNEYEKALPHFIKACSLDRTKVAFEEFRTSASKIRNANVGPVSAQYDRGVATCFE